MAAAGSAAAGGVVAKDGVVERADEDMGLAEVGGQEVAAPATAPCPVLAELRRKALAGGPAYARQLALLDEAIAVDAARAGRMSGSGSDG